MDAVRRGGNPAHVWGGYDVAQRDTPGMIKRGDKLGLPCTELDYVLRTTEINFSTGLNKSI